MIRNKHFSCVFQGTAFDLRYPYIIMGFLFVTGIFAALFLPETLHQRLPETLADAQNFGRDQYFWSLPRKQDKETSKNKNEMVDIPLKT